MTLDNIHLTQAAKDLLGEPDILRVRAIKARRWIFYPRAKQALDRLNLLLDHPRGTRMPSIAIYGDSGMGKTMIMEKFCDNHPSCFDPTTGVQTMPVLAIEMTGKPGSGVYMPKFWLLLARHRHPAPTSCRWSRRRCDF